MSFASLDLWQRHGEPRYYRQFADCVCRLTCGLQGVDRTGRLQLMPEGSLVYVRGGEYLDEPTEDDDCFRFTVELLKKSGALDPRNITTDGVPDSALRFEPGVISWPAEMSQLAMGQGWDICHSAGSAHGLWQLCQIDEENRFGSDPKAWEFVWRRAVEERDPVALHALAFLRVRAPREYRRVTKAGRKALRGG